MDRMDVPGQSCLDLSSPRRVAPIPAFALPVCRSRCSTRKQLIHLLWRLLCINISFVFLLKTRLTFCESVSLTVPLYFTPMSFLTWRPTCCCVQGTVSPLFFSISVSIGTGTPFDCILPQDIRFRSCSGPDKRNQFAFSSARKPLLNQVFLVGHNCTPPTFLSPSGATPLANKSLATLSAELSTSTPRFLSLPSFFFMRRLSSRSRAYCLYHTFSDLASRTQTATRLIRSSVSVFSVVFPCASLLSISCDRTAASVCVRSTARRK